MEHKPMTFVDDCAHAIAAEAHFLRGDELDDWHDHLAAEDTDAELENRQPHKA